MNKTFVILKPDCQERGLIGEVIKRFEQKYLRIIGLQLRWKSKEWARKHYQHLSGEILERNVVFMTTAPLIGIVLDGPNAITVVRVLVGDTIYSTPGRIRGDYETYLPYNIVHASDTEENCIQEIKEFFDSATDKK